jgi:hypothetical protein
MRTDKPPPKHDQRHGVRRVDAESHLHASAALMALVGMTDIQPGGQDSHPAESKAAGRWDDCMFLTTASGAVGAAYLETRSVAVGVATAVVAVVVAWRRGDRN